MNLNAPQEFARIDTQNLLEMIEQQPQTLLEAWQSGLQQSNPGTGQIKQVILAGSSAFTSAAECVVTTLRPACLIPLSIEHGDQLPAWAHGPETLLVTAALDAEEQLGRQLLRAGSQQNCSLFFLDLNTTARAEALPAGTVVWQWGSFAPGWAKTWAAIGLLLAAFAHLNLTGARPAEISLEIQKAVESLRQQYETLNSGSPLARNPAKRLAGQLMGRWVTLISSRQMVPAARRWKYQINGLAKTWAQAEQLSQSFQETINAILEPQAQTGHAMLLFLHAPSDDLEDQQQLELLRQVFMQAGMGTDRIDAQGESLLANLLTALQYGDYVAYYLALAYDINPAALDWKQII